MSCGTVRQPLTCDVMVQMRLLCYARAYQQKNASMEAMEAEAELLCR